MNVVVEKHIKHFNTLNGKIVHKHTLQTLLSNVKSAAHPDLLPLQQRLETAISKMNGKPVRLSFTPMAIPKPAPAPLPKKPALVPVVKLPEVKPKPVVAPAPKPSKKLDGVVSAGDIAKMKFTRIELSAEYKKDFGAKIFSDTQILIWGSPGHGKTVYLLKLAEYLKLKKDLRVLFVANEEMNRSTLTEKINQFKISDKVLFSKTLPHDLSAFDVIIFDSVQSIGFTLDKYKKFLEENPGKIYILVAQSTKDGDFRGGKDWEHEVDIAGEIRNRKLVLRKNRLDPEMSVKSDKLLLAEKVDEARKKLQIKEAIKPKPQTNDNTTAAISA